MMVQICTIPAAKGLRSILCRVFNSKVRFGPISAMRRCRMVGIDSFRPCDIPERSKYSHKCPNQPGESRSSKSAVYPGFRQNGLKTCNAHFICPFHFCNMGIIFFTHFSPSSDNIFNFGQKIRQDT